MVTQVINNKYGNTVQLLKWTWRVEPRKDHVSNTKCIYRFLPAGRLCTLRISVTGNEQP